MLHNRVFDLNYLLKKNITNNKNKLRSYVPSENCYLALPPPAGSINRIRIHPIHQLRIKDSLARSKVITVQSFSFLQDEYNIKSAMKVSRYNKLNSYIYLYVIQ